MSKQPKSKTKPDDPVQSKRFIETAAQVGADDENTLEQALKKIAPQKKRETSRKNA